MACIKATDTYKGVIMRTFIIDVSTHQKEIDWLKAKNQGVRGAILRIGYTGWGSLESYIDAYFERNYKGVTQVDLPVGVYFLFIQCNYEKLN